MEEPTESVPDLKPDIMSSEITDPKGSGMTHNIDAEIV